MMSDELIPEDVREFILKSIDSIAQLEALLLLRREPDTNWSAATIADRLYVDKDCVEAVLDRLCSEGLIIVSGGDYRFDCAAGEKRDLVDLLAVLYSRHLIPVTNSCMRSHPAFAPSLTHSSCERTDE